MSFINGATISGGDLTQTRRVSLPEGSDRMKQIEVPIYQQTSFLSVRPCHAWPACAVGVAPAPREPAAGELQYEIALHYDFARFGGRRDWRGRFDGVDLLYFPEHMVVGNGVWGAGWYRAEPALRGRLNGSWHVSPWDKFVALWSELALATLVGAIVVGVARSHLRRGSFIEPEVAPPHLIRERIAQGRSGCL